MNNTEEELYNSIQSLILNYMKENLKEDDPSRCFAEISLVLNQVYSSLLCSFLVDEVHEIILSRMFDNIKIHCKRINEKHMETNSKSIN